MTERTLLAQLATESGKLKQNIEVAQDHDFADRADIRAILVSITAVLAVVDKLAAIEPRVKP